jgi:hypothetical protein
MIHIAKRKWYSSQQHRITASINAASCHGSWSASNCCNTLRKVWDSSIQQSSQLPKDFEFIYQPGVTLTVVRNRWAS